MIADRAFADRGSPTREELVWAALSVWAPSSVLNMLLSLPDRSFADADEVWSAVRRNCET